jgi:predicted RNA-binding Zn-ribbon protein involved in translation (DUF1610 family)
MTTAKKDDAMRCTSCGRRVEADSDWVEFKCPGCRKERILRCDSCKRLENTYKCKCGFEGP